ncbi:MAG: bifunctional DNA-formamidopyrimidine glycosylase/DNA-(apurinic or apyrimidinic site) lyase [Micavibrio sp.]
MPELPEVETVCRGLEPVLKGHVITHADVRRKDLRKPFPRGLAAHLKGCTVQGLSRRAKYILIHLDNSYVLVIHLGMSGRIVFQDQSYIPATHDHFILRTDAGMQIVLNDPRRFGVVDLIAEENVAAHTLFKHLGPEPLASSFTGSFLHEALSGRKTAVKVALMDQRLVVGVGNIYASEALYRAGINPERAAGTIDKGEAVSLVKAIKEVLREAIKAGGSTLKDHRQANGELGYFQHSFAVYDREGDVCPVGRLKKTARGHTIRRIIQGGRSTFYCPACQK